MERVADGAHTKGMLPATYLAGLRDCLAALPMDRIAALASAIESAWRERTAVLVMGNGGSAATASHMSTDLAGAVDKGRGLRVMALADNAPRITAIANDTAFDYVFSDQIDSLAARGDLVLALTVSGRSTNILEGLRAARRVGARTFGLLGCDGGEAVALVDDHVLAESWEYGHVEGAHLAVSHFVTRHLRIAARPAS